LFGDASEVQIAEPQVPPCEEWSTMEKLAKEKEVVGIYISGHPLDDYKFEMKYFCTAKLESLKNLEQHLGKNLSFGGIVTNVQHRTAKNGKGWATFVLEGYDESYEFRIFDEEYLKYRHFLLQNQFVYFKINVKEGWVNRETGKKSDPRIQFLDAKMLADVLPTFAKKLILMFPINDVKEQVITELNRIFSENKGDNSVTFEVMELERIKKIMEDIPVSDPVDIEEEISEDSNEEMEMNIEVPVEKEEIIVKTKLSMPSRKLKVKISSELLQELERMQVNFKLN
jgi:DNA polymerase-3 subunit alpha